MSFTVFIVYILSEWISGLIGASLVTLLGAPTFAHGMLIVRLDGGIVAGACETFAFHHPLARLGVEAAIGLLVMGIEPRRPSLAAAS